MEKNNVITPIDFIEELNSVELNDDVDNLYNVEREFKQSLVKFNVTYNELEQQDIRLNQEISKIMLAIFQYYKNQVKEMEEYFSESKKFKFNLGDAYANAGISDKTIYKHQDGKYKIVKYYAMSLSDQFFKIKSKYVSVNNKNYLNIEEQKTDFEENEEKIAAGALVKMKLENENIKNQLNRTNNKMNELIEMIENTNDIIKVKKFVSKLKRGEY